MGVYIDTILPRLCHLSMRNRLLTPYRQRAIAAASGRVLEIGSGSGLNLPYYGPAVRELVAVEPSRQLTTLARRSARETSLSVTFVEGSAEAIPLESNSFDSVVTTWTLCTIPRVDDALQEARRVLRPGGRLIFVEHGRAPDTRVWRWQDRLTPLWRPISGGCHLNRSIADLIASAGFEIEGLKTGYMAGPKVMTFMYEGTARLRA